MAPKKESRTLQDQLNILLGGQVFEETEKRLVFGSVFIVPNNISGIPSTKRKKGKTFDHPFEVIKYFKGSNRTVLCALRTTNLEREGLYTRENILPQLDKEGIILFDEPFRIDAQKFVDFAHLGILPEECLQALKKAVTEKGWL
jgi:hypothetical protein